jgi:LPS sulfotransferase NodH
LLRARPGRLPHRVDREELTNTEEDIFFEFEDAGEPRVSYLVCSIPRSGSTLLCDLLAATGVAGAPIEVFHPDFMRVLARRWGTETTEAYVGQLLARKTGPNGVFGAKAHWAQYHPLFGEADPRTVLPNLRVILMSRRDRLRQAVSWVRALQTLRWHSGGRERSEREASYDPAHISRKVDRIGREEDAWRGLFERHGIESHLVVYEELVADQSGTVSDALEFIGVEPRSDLRALPPPLERQADALSEQWVERYRAETDVTQRP